ncbi:MAG: WXG100 family type VII secretion target [Eubacterium sp.]|nr:WXG100 family type VII secretion target [Eubacterium sp.]
MADIIKVSPEKLTASAASLGSIGKSIKKTTGQMLTLVTGISQNVWSGEASGAFVRKFQGLQTDITKMCRRLDEQSSHLKTIAKEYQTTEAANKAAAARLKNQAGV